MIKLSEKAQQNVKKMLETRAPGDFFRVSVKGGGCSGLSYDVKFDNEMSSFDRAYDLSGVKVVCDSKSFIYLDGMEIDFSDELVGGGFKFINPNASGSCGCGSSFSV